MIRNAPLTPNLPATSFFRLVYSSVMNTVSYNRLEKAVEIAAILVHDLGDEYWPVFESLEAELIRRQSRYKRLCKFKTMHESDLSKFD